MGDKGYAREHICGRIDEDGPMIAPLGPLGSLQDVDMSSLAAPTSGYWPDGDGAHVGP